MESTSPANSVPDGEPCKCIELTNAALVKHNTRLGLSWTVDRKTGKTLTTIDIDTRILEKKRGARPIQLLATYCPFCGQRYQSEAQP